MEVLVFSRCFASAVRDQVSLPKRTCLSSTTSHRQPLFSFPSQQNVICEPTGMLHLENAKGDSRSWCCSSIS